MKAGLFPSIRSYDRAPNSMYMAYTGLSRMFPGKDIADVIYNPNTFVEKVEEIALG